MNKDVLKMLATEVRKEPPVPVDVRLRVMRSIRAHAIAPDRSTEHTLEWLAVLSGAVAFALVLPAMDAWTALMNPVSDFLGNMLGVLT